MKQIVIISVFLLLMVLLFPVAERRLRHRTKQLMVSKACILTIYLFANFYLTLLSRKATSEYSMKLQPFESYFIALQGNADSGIQIILNIFLYVPLGYLLRFTFARVKGWQVITIGCLFSMLTETTQLVFKLGMFELDDMISNTLGTVIGIACYWGRKKVRHRARTTTAPVGDD